MTIDPTSATSPTSGTSLYTGSTAPAASTGTNQLGQDAFLKLLVAQLKYQDPSKPADSSQMMAQTAQFQMVQQLTTLADSNAKLLQGQNTLGALEMVGRTVSYSSGDTVATGSVTGVSFTASGAVLRVGTQDVPLSDVTQITSTG